MDIGGPLIVDLPQRRARRRLIEESSRRRPPTARASIVTGPFAPGTTRVQHRVRAAVQRAHGAARAAWPVAAAAAHVFALKTGDLDLASPQIASKQRESTEQGQPLIVGRSGDGRRRAVRRSRSPACRIIRAGRAYVALGAGRRHRRRSGSGRRSSCAPPRPRASVRPEPPRWRSAPALRRFRRRRASRDVSRHYGRRRALSHVSLDSAPARSVGLFGPNGAGKSTLLGVLADADPRRRRRGPLRRATRRATGRRAARAHRRARPRPLSVRRPHGAREPRVLRPALRRSTDLRARVSTPRSSRGAALDRADDRVGGFSRGLRQRLALERALLHGPRSSCSTSRSPGSTTSRRRCSSARLRALRERRRDRASWRRTTSRAPTARRSRRRVCEDGALVDDPGGRGPLRERYRAGTARRRAA